MIGKSVFMRQNHCLSYLLRTLLLLTEKIFFSQSRTIVLMLFTLSVFFINCSRHYSGDIDEFTLNSRWLFVSADSNAQKDSIFFAAEHFTEFRNRLIGNKGLFRKTFVLDAHFTESKLFLVLLKHDIFTDITLNGIKIYKSSHHITGLNNTPLQNSVLLFDDSYLNFGKKNILEFSTGNVQNMDSLTFSRAGIFSPPSMLQVMGFQVVECPYRAEKNIHAILEDISQAWRQQDSLMLHDFFSSSFEDADTVIQSLTAIIRQLEPTAVELYEPVFCCNSEQTSVIALGEWILHYPDHSNDRFPFSWKFIRIDGKWFIEEIL